ncbi:MAG: 2-dehydropantoate 2-reductase, partial [Zymomonas sp.]
TENDALIGMVARLGAEHDVPTPICAAVSDMIALIERHPGESIW